jgi:predicted nucleotidyltransferase
MSILTPVRAATILALDSAQDGLSLSQTAHAIEAPLSSTQRALGDLVKTGAVTVERHRYRPVAAYPWKALAAIATVEVDPVRRTRLRQRATTAGARIPATSRDRIAELPATDLVKNVIAVAVDRIVERVHPLQIILFGSQARGEAWPDSDIDLLVIEETVTDRQAATVELLRALAGIGIAKDVIVATPETLAAASPDSVTAAAVREGRTVYERG